VVRDHGEQRRARVEPRLRPLCGILCHHFRLSVLLEIVHFIKMSRITKTLNLNEKHFVNHGKCVIVLM
jgi:hypothetical protein